MKSFVFAALFALSAPACAANVPAASWPEMTSGRYEVELEGMLCRVCARLVSEEAGKLQEVEKAGTDLDVETLSLTVRPGRKLALSKLLRALTRAARRANLGTRYEIVSIRYKV